MRDDAAVSKSAFPGIHLWFSHRFTYPLTNGEFLGVSRRFPGVETGPNSYRTLKKPPAEAGVSL